MGGYNDHAVNNIAIILYYEPHYSKVWPLKYQFSIMSQYWLGEHSIG